MLNGGNLNWERVAIFGVVANGNFGVVLSKWRRLQSHKILLDVNLWVCKLDARNSKNYGKTSWSDNIDWESKRKVESTSKTFPSSTLHWILHKRRSLKICIFSYTTIILLCLKIIEKGLILRGFWQHEACGQTVLPDRSNRSKIVGKCHNWKKCDFFENF